MAREILRLPYFPREKGIIGHLRKQEKEDGSSWAEVASKR